MEAPLQLVGCLLGSEAADPALIEGFVTAVRRERAVVTARHAHGATFVRFNAADAKLLAMACAAATGSAGAALRFGFACAVKSRASAGPEAWGLSNRCIARARDLAAAAQGGEVLVSPQLALLLLESGFTLEAKEVGIASGRQVMACALGAGAAAGDHAASPEEPPERSALRAVEAGVDARLAQQLARHSEAQRLKGASDTLLAQVADVQRKLDGHLSELRAKVEDLLGRVHDTDAKIETIESRRKMVEEVQTRANGIVHMLEDVHVKLELLNEQRAVVDHVGEKLARLDFTLQEAHNTLRALQREREVAERIEQGIKALRARSGGIHRPSLQGEG